MASEFDYMHPELNYKGFEYSYDENEVILYLSPYHMITFETDSELFAYVDDLDLDLEEDSSKWKDLIEKEYYIYRIHPNDKDTFSNYQFYTRDGRFLYRATDNIECMTKTNALSRVHSFRDRNDGYWYYMARYKSG